MTKETINNFAKGKGYYGAEYLKKWNGYECYEPTMDNADGEPACIGLPLVILVKGETIRMSTIEEAFII